MHNKVVYRIARALRQTGFVVLRFNYRGVNLSEGEYDDGKGETEDARTALADLRTRYPGIPTSIAGFSFGSRVALRLAGQEQDLKKVIAVGFPTTILDRAYVGDVKVPKYFVHSTQDQFGPRDEFTAFYESLAEPKHLDWVTSSDHFFKDALDEFETAIERIGRID